MVNVIGSYRNQESSATGRTALVPRAQLVILKFELFQDARDAAGSGHRRQPRKSSFLDPTRNSSEEAG